MNTFTINKKKYVAKEFSFGLMCDLEDMGYTLADLAKKPTSMVRSYFALCADVDKEEANAILEKHLISGGSLKGVMDAMSKEMLASDFFQSLMKTDETETVEEK